MGGVEGFEPDDGSGGVVVGGDTASGGKSTATAGLPAVDEKSTPRLSYWWSIRAPLLIGEAGRTALP